MTTAVATKSIYTPVTMEKVKAGHYELVSEKGVVIGYVHKRCDDWYGEMIHTSPEGQEFFHNQCGTSRQDVMMDLDRLSPRRINYYTGRGSEENTASIQRLRQNLTTKTWVW